MSSDWSAARSRVKMAQLVALTFVVSIVGMVLLLTPLAKDPEFSQKLADFNQTGLMLALITSLLLSHSVPRMLLVSQLKRLSGVSSRIERLSALYLSASIIGSALREGVGMIGIVFALVSQQQTLVAAFGAVGITLICVNWPSEEGLRRLEVGIGRDS